MRAMFPAVRFAFALVVFVLGCSSGPNLECEGEALFGRPTEDTGLGAQECAPVCTSCGGEEFTPPTYIGADLDALRALEIVEGPAELTADPYGMAFDDPMPDEVCGVGPQELLVEGRYRLQTFESGGAAEADGFRVSHRGPCGRCSTLEDLAVYIAYGDLTTPVRACGLAHLLSTQEEHVRCLTELGFTKPCAQIWYYNTKNTQAVCADQCFSAIGDPYHTPDGAINPCLDCDEKRSGGVFKAVAGRTRRNSGLPTAICRPCSTVTPLAHDYRP